MPMLRQSDNITLDDKKVKVLEQKTVHGVTCVALITIIRRFLNFIVKIILARLLEPTDFGLVAIGLLVINTFDLFRELGFSSALIYKGDDSEHTAANTAFIILPIIGTILFVVSYISAHYIATFFNNPTIEHIIRILSLTFIISSFGNVPYTLIEKELEFKKEVLPETISRIGYACVAIGLALLGYGVWSIVYGQVISVALLTVFVWLVSDWRPSFNFDITVAKDLFGYGKHALAASIFVFIVTNIDDAIIGKIIGITALGFYTVAYSIATLPTTNITYLVTKVAFPMYSKLREDERVLKKAFLKTVNYVAMICIPVSFGIFILAPEIIHVVFGDKWSPSIPLLQILCVYALSRSLLASCGSVMYAVGRPDINKNIMFSASILSTIMIPIFALKVGLIGATIAVALVYIFILFMQYYYALGLVRAGFFDLIRVLYKPFIASSGMLILIFMIKYFVEGVELLLLGMITGISSYLILISFLSNNEEKKEILNLLNYFRCRG